MMQLASSEQGESIARECKPAGKPLLAPSDVKGVRSDRVLLALVLAQRATAANLAADELHREALKIVLAR
jgi:hypothetical protein